MRHETRGIDRKSDPGLSTARAIVYWAGFAGEHYLRLSGFKRLRSRVTKELLERNLPEKGKLPIPKIDPASITPEQFLQNYIRPNVPIVLKGLGSDWPAVKKWTPDFFHSTYGSDIVGARTKSRGVGVESLDLRDMPLAELIDNLRNGGEYYASNLEDLFNNHPELRDDLLLRQVEKYSCVRPPSFAPGAKRRWRFPRFGEVLSTQLFMSNSIGRAGYHCASGGNFFLQVHGKKKWVFVNPRHTPFMYPVVRKDFIYSASPVDDRLNRDELEEAGFALYSRIPKYEVVLDPGDILLSPQWWWHTVENIGDSIGIAMRFRTGMFAGNPVYSAMTMVSPNLVRHFINVVRTGWGSDATAARRIFEPEGNDANVRFAPPDGKQTKSRAASS